MTDLAPGVPTDLSKSYRVPNSTVDAFSNVFGKDIQMPDDGTLYVEVCLTLASANSLFKVMREGASSLGTLNNGNDLVAGNVYAFEVTYQAGERVNFQFTQSVGLNWLRVLYRRWV